MRAVCVNSKTTHKSKPSVSLKVSVRILTAAGERRKEGSKIAFSNRLIN